MNKGRMNIILLPAIPIENSRTCPEGVRAYRVDGRLLLGRRGKGKTMADATAKESAVASVTRKNNR